MVTQKQNNKNKQGQPKEKVNASLSVPDITHVSKMLVPTLNKTKIGVSVDKEVIRIIREFKNTNKINISFVINEYLWTIANSLTKKEELPKMLQ